MRLYFKDIGHIHKHRVSCTGTISTMGSMFKNRFVEYDVIFKLLLVFEVVIILIIMENMIDLLVNY